MKPVSVTHAYGSRVKISTSEPNTQWVCEDKAVILIVEELTFSTEYDPIQGLHYARHLQGMEFWREVST